MDVSTCPPLHATAELARRVDRAEIDFCALAATTSRGGPADSLEAGGGCALYAGPGSPLNKVLGLGLGQDAGEADLDAIAAFYRQRSAPVQIELCPLAQPGLSARLSARGYVLQAFENELGRRMSGPAPARAAPPGVGIAIAGAAQDDVWVDATARGFGAPEATTVEPDDEAVGALAPIMRQFTHPAIARYLAWVDGEAAGGGASWAQDGVLGVFGTATSLRFRGRGIQVAITAAALSGAGPDVDLAIATTAPGSQSQRNFERLGFQVLYTRAIFVLEKP